MIWADFKTSSRSKELLSDPSFMISSTDPLTKSSILFLASQGSVMLHYHLHKLAHGCGLELPYLRQPINDLKNQYTISCCSVEETPHLKLCHKSTQMHSWSKSKLQLTKQF